ncbi:MAG: alpha/beta hydrolase [Anaerolineae bacterium]|nr:alpha/beta hydrolase [Anaerolineae bacterium]
MKTGLTIIKWFLSGLLLLLLLLIAGSSINHRLQTPREEAAYPPPGQLVPVNGHSLHVYAEGEGNLTLVFLSGSGTTAPTLDFRGLYRRLSKEYRTVVVERAGYGWSEGGGTSRDIDTVLGETRRALELAGESPPYVLLPHSMSGLEALHWANRYPNEVAAIIGLDPATPPIYELMPPPRLQLALIGFTARTGLLRLAPFICHEAAAVNHLTAAETAAYCSIMYRRTLTADMLAEVEMTQTNAQLVAAEGIPVVPLYVFISNGDGLPMDNWGEVLANYTEAAGGQYTLLDVGHYVHNEAADVIAEESRSFLQQLVSEMISQ